MDRDLIEFTNIKLQEGFNLAYIEQELGFGKDTLRKRIKRLGYVYNRKTKQYVPQDNIEEHKPVTQQNTKSYKPITQSNIDELTTDEIMFIKTLYKQSKMIEEVNNIESNDDIINRSIRVSKTLIDNFAEFCKENNLKQTNAIGLALLDFIKKYNKY